MKVFELQKKLLDLCYKGIGNHETGVDAVEVNQTANRVLFVNLKTEPAKETKAEKLTPTLFEKKG